MIAFTKLENGLFPICAQDRLTCLRVRFMKQNGSDQGRFEVYTGSDGNLSRYLNIVSWNSHRRMDLWPKGKDSPCNTFQDASDGSAFGPFVKPTQRLRYVSDSHSILVSQVIQSFISRLCLFYFEPKDIFSENVSRGV